MLMNFEYLLNEDVNNGTVATSRLVMECSNQGANTEVEREKHGMEIGDEREVDNGCNAP